MGKLNEQKQPATDAPPAATARDDGPPLPLARAGMRVALDADFGFAGTITHLTPTHAIVTPDDGAESVYGQPGTTLAIAWTAVALAGAAPDLAPAPDQPYVSPRQADTDWPLNPLDDAGRMLAALVAAMSDEAEGARHRACAALWWCHNHADQWSRNAVGDFMKAWDVIAKMPGMPAAIPAELRREPPARVKLLADDSIFRWLFAELENEGLSDFEQINAALYWYWKGASEDDRNTMGDLWFERLVGLDHLDDRPDPVVRRQPWPTSPAGPTSRESSSLAIVREISRLAAINLELIRGGPIAPADRAAVDRLVAAAESEAA